MGRRVFQILGIAIIAFALSACCVCPGTKSSSTSSTKVSVKAEGKTSSSAKVKTGATATAGASARASTKKTGHAHASGKYAHFGFSAKVSTKAKRAKAPAKPKYKARFNYSFSGKVSAKASGSASVSAKASASAKGNAKPQTAPGKHHKPAKRQPDSKPTFTGKPHEQPIKQTGPAGTPPPRPVLDPEPKTPPPPPAEPPANVFGYEDPVLGCFEGEVMFLAPGTKMLPKKKDWGALQVESMVYACEWDIAPRAFDQGFPGVDDRYEWFAIRYTGKFRMAEAGKYKFRINSDDGARLYIDGKLVVNNDGVHPPKSKTGTVHLTKGDHDLVLEYFQGPRYKIALQVYLIGPDGEEGIFSVRE